MYQRCVLTACNGENLTTLKLWRAEYFLISIDIAATANCFSRVWQSVRDLGKLNIQVSDGIIIDVSDMYDI